MYPFSTWSVIISLLLGIPAIVILIYTLVKAEHLDVCDNNYILANCIEFAVYAIDIAFVIYSVRKIGEGFYRTYETEEKPHAIGSEVVKFLCFDFFVLFFIFFYFASLAWDVVMLVWANSDNDACEDQYEGVLEATNFFAGWHIAMMFMGVFWFLMALCLLSFSESRIVKPFLKFCICGMDFMQKEKERRRQLGRERRDKYHRENQIHQNQHEPVTYYPPDMENHAHKRAPVDPYNNASAYPVNNSRHPDTEK